MKYVLKNLETTLQINNIVNIHFFEFPADFYTVPDSHPFYELIFVSSGALDIVSDNYEGRLEKNQMIIHRPNETHSLNCDVLNTPKVIIIGFSCSSKIIDKFSKSPIKLRFSEIRKLAEIIKEGRNLFAPPYNVPLFDMKKKENPPLGTEQMIRLLLEYFLISICRYDSNFNKLNKEEENQKISEREIVKYIKENFTEKISLDELAFIFRTNRSTLCKEFKNYTGKTIVEYFNIVKIENAKKKILSTNKTFTEISQQLNFDSVYYFTRLFKAITGITPKEFRKLYKK